MAQLKTKYIENAAVTLAKMADMVTASILGRNTAGTGVPEVLSKATVLSILNVADGANAYVHPNHSGDVVSVADGATTIANEAVTLAKMANMVTASILGRKTAASGVPEVLSKTDVLTLLNVEDGATAGGETKKVEILTIIAADITAKYRDLASVPATAGAVAVIPVGGIPQEYVVDFTVITDGAVVKRLNWSALGLESLLAADDKIVVSYSY